MAIAKKGTDRAGLVQGTLDMLMLRTLLFGPAHGHQIAKHIQRTTEEVLQSSTARSTPRSTGWKERAGSPGNGSSPGTGTGSSNIIASPRPAKSISRQKSRNGNGSPQRSRR